MVWLPPGCIVPTFDPDTSGRAMANPLSFQKFTVYCAGCVSRLTRTMVVFQPPPSAMCEMVCIGGAVIFSVMLNVKGLLLALAKTLTVSVYCCPEISLVASSKIDRDPGVVNVPPADGVAARVTVAHATPSSVTFCRTMGVLGSPDVRLMVCSEDILPAGTESVSDDGDVTSCGVVTLRVTGRVNSTMLSVSVKSILPV